MVREIIRGRQSRETFYIADYQYFWCLAHSINCGRRKQIGQCGRRTRKFHKHFPFLIYYNNYIIVFYFCQIKWRRKWDSNSQPELYKGPALAVGAIPPYGRDGANWTLINCVSDSLPTIGIRLYETVSSTTVNSSHHYFTSVESPKSYMNGTLNEIRTRISTLRGWPPKPLVRWEHKWWCGWDLNPTIFTVKEWWLRQFVYRTIEVKKFLS